MYEQSIDQILSEYSGLGIRRVKMLDSNIYILSPACSNVLQRWSYGAKWDIHLSFIYTI